MTDDRGIFEEDDRHGDEREKIKINYRSAWLAMFAIWRQGDNKFRPFRAVVQVRCANSGRRISSDGCKAEDTIHRRRNVTSPSETVPPIAPNWVEGGHAPPTTWSSSYATQNNCTAGLGRLRAPHIFADEGLVSLRHSWLNQARLHTTGSYSTLSFRVILIRVRQQTLTMRRRKDGRVTSKPTLPLRGWLSRRDRRWWRAIRMTSC